MIILGTRKRIARNYAVPAIFILLVPSACLAQTSATLGSNLMAPAIESFSPQPVSAPSLSAAAGAPRPSLGDAPPSPTTISYGRWDLDLGAVFTRFSSSIFTASMVGVRSSLAYHFNDWLAAEGAVTSGFAPQIFDRDHVKYVDYMAGLRVGPTRDRFSPWVHGAIGGAHMLPQTADNSKNSFAAKAGVGLDYQTNSSVSLRAQIDWLGTRFFGETQNNFQASASLVVHFDRIF